MQQHHDGVDPFAHDERGSDGRDVTTILDADATIRYVSPSIEPILGYKPEQLVGQNWFQYVHPDDAAQALPGFGQTSQQPGVVQRNAVRVRHANGSWVSVEEVGSNLLHYPAVHGWILNARNVGAGGAVMPSVASAGGEDVIAAAIARVASDLLGVLTPTQILERLCHCANEILQCDCSHAFLLDPAIDAFIPMAHCGDTPEQWESLQRLRIARATLVSWQSARVDGDEQITGTHPLGRLQRQHGIAVSICAPLLNGTDTIGYLHVGRCNPRAAFNDLERHLATRIAHLGSLALEAAQRCEALERSSRWRTQFVSTLSHELRTPLNVIIGYHDLLLDGTFGALSSQQAYTLRRAHRSAREMLDIITSTLDLSRMDAGRLRLSVQTVAIGDLLDELARETLDLCDKPGVTVEWNVAADIAKVSTDPVKLKMILKNLIGNAVKFTDHGTVTVAALPQSDAVEITVSDTGIGMSQDALALMLEPARYSDASTLERFGGTGLGLYIVRRLLDLLGGTITVATEPGTGSTFHIFIPSDAKQMRANGEAR